MERVSDQEMYAAMAAHSRTHKPAFNTKNALKELHSYAVKYSSEVSEEGGWERGERERERDKGEKRETR